MEQITQNARFNSKICFDSNINSRSNKLYWLLGETLTYRHKIWPKDFWKLFKVSSSVPKAPDNLEEYKSYSQFWKCRTASGSSNTKDKKILFNF